MSPTIATIVFAAGMLVLFRLEKERAPRVSVALWLPTVWLAIGASRMFSLWFQEMMEPEFQPLHTYEEGSPLDRALLSVVLAGGLITLAGRGHRVQQFLRANWPLLLFFGFACLSVLWSDYSFVAFKRWAKALGNLVMVLVVLTDPHPKEAVKRLFVRVGFLLLVVSVLFIKYIPEYGRIYHRFSGTTFYTGVSTTKNGLGAMCLVFGLASFWRLVELYGHRQPGGGPGPLIAHGIALATALWLLWLSNSATSTGCFLIGSVLILASKRRMFAGAGPMLHTLVIGIIALGIFGLIVAPELGLVEVVDRDVTLTGRTEIWAQVLQMNVNPWVGVGFESFWLGHRLEHFAEIYYWRPNQAHNGYLETYITLGWIGVALLMFTIFWGYGNVVGSLRQDPELGRLWLAFFVVALLFNLTEAAFKVMHPIWIVFLLSVAVIPPLARRQESTWPIGEREAAPGRRETATAAPYPGGRSGD